MIHLIVQCTFVLIAASVPLSTYTEKGLFEAARDGDLKYVKEALTAGVDPDWQNDIGYSALMIAAEKGHIRVIKELIKSGANLELTNLLFGYTALHLAVDNNQSAAVRELVRAGANVNVKMNFLEWTPLMRAALRDSIDIDIIEMLLADPDVDLDLTGITGFTALHDAAAGNHLAAAQLLLEKGANKTILNIMGQTPAELARDRNNFEVAKLIEEF